MPQIHILPTTLRNKIAAGEVVERPASAVKELIENSIDAESTEIRVEVLYGGKRLVRVSDNGIGMDKEDALLCFERYATSKLLKEEDLFNVQTMGFRGEALASVASVAKVKLITAPKGNHQGVSVEIQGGEVKEVKDSPSIGTTVEVRDLFFNTPARRKFLKTNSTELLHIIEKVTEEALSHFEISFTLLSDNHEALNLPAASCVRERILQVYGNDFLSDLREGNAEDGVIEMQSFVARDSFRSSKSHQFIFINRRPIRDSSIMHAVYRAYEGMLPSKRHPVFFLFVNINPRMFDCNVHPSKREVRFLDKEYIYNFIYTSIRSILSHVSRPISDEPLSPSLASDSSPSHSGISSFVSEPLEFGYKPSLSLLYLGESFIAFSDRGGVTLVDQHAAHERILYEKFLKGINLTSYRLLFPRQVRLSHKEYRVILEKSIILRDFGIEVEDFGSDTVIVHSLPDALREADIKAILSDIVSCLLEGVSLDKDLKEVLAAKIACHKSVRGKIVLTQEEVSRLLSELRSCQNPDRCPHGRPTRIFFSLEDLKKMFKRK